MCGISAVLSLGSHPASSNQEHALALDDELNASLDLVQHRGPDARGTWTSDDGKVSLGHVRLSIVDLSPEANQPFHDSVNDVHAIVNGELYDDEYYRDLLGTEYDFRSRSDCEIVLALYKHYGLSFLSHLRGEFALILWDARRKVFIGARDRYGVKSLYYTIVNNQLLVATEMKCFLPFGWKPEWDIQGLRECGWVFGTGTMFKGVQSVAPGHYILSRNFSPIKDAVYWDAEYPDKNTPELRSESEMTEGVRSRLMEAIKVRLRADVPVGIYLSGGIDSSAVAGMVAHLVKEEGARMGNDQSHLVSRMKCFTVQFDKDSGADESDIAQRTAEWLGVEFHPVPITEETIVSKFEDTIWHSEVPLPDTNGIGRLAMAEAAKSQGIKVILTGEGSDEHFGGYKELANDFLLESDPSWSPSLTRAELAEIQQQQCGPDHAAYLAIKAVRSLPESTCKMLNNISVLTKLALVSRLPFASWTEPFTATHPETAQVEGLDGRVRDLIINRWHPLHTAEYILTKGLFPNLLLRYLGDNVDMVHHVETRPPFLDHHLTAYVNNLPPSLKIKCSLPDKSLTEKYILREAVRPFVTDEIYKRPKKPYVGPAKFPENGPLHQLFLRLISRENVEALGFLDWTATEQLVSKAFRDQNPLCFRAAFQICQMVVISQRFGVAKASA
ncbi:hypothetical protein N7533_007362 [Penicillium manginii]|uniref:uncharacterized protein n=1 Tax=Penicillium manginii TaxID=203109 RepID=UPI0025486CD3|nr:uncharacterized protein N7533_007362 [Penicillium manginii]KAJ5750334.1 hypothetical protein N7533_007362 [Penicillium manginii]